MATVLLVKAGLLVLAPDGATVRQTLAFPCNPETLTRQIGAAAEPTRRVETLRLEAHIDAHAMADALQHDPQGGPAGIAPWLAALEALVQPVAEREANAPLVLLVWGRQRVQPVRVVALGIVEQDFDRALNPLRAHVTLELQALTAQELGTGSRGAHLLAVHARTRAALAARIGPQGLHALGLSALP